MADSRINALATTASSTASDDFLVVDGATNGTRKLNAYSPTFGGNATVTGTLTVNGGFTVGATVQMANTATLASGTRLTLDTQAQQGIDIFRSDSNANFSAIRFRDTTNANTNAQIGWSGTTLRLDGTVVSIPGTTASTSTSTGALVVSGGVGVAGNINGGGDITLATNTKAFYNLNYANAKGVQVGYFARGENNGWTTGLHFYSSNTNYSATLVHQPGSGDLTLYTTSSASDYTASEAALVVTAAKQVQVKATTASSSTTTGALVVSGGVGVAGGISSGSTIRVFGASHRTRVLTSSAHIDFTDTSEIAYVSGTIIGNTLQLSGNNGTGITIGTTGIVTLGATTASTSTSTGALVVSGGVGVAGAIYAGGMIQSGGALQASMGGTTNATTLNLIGGGSSDGNYLNFADVNIGGQGLGAAFLRWTRDNGLGRAFSIHVSNNAGNTTTAAWFDVSGNVIQKVNGTAPSLTSNSTMTFELTSNTSLKIFVRGSDGTTRSTTLTLA